MKTKEVTTTEIVNYETGEVKEIQRSKTYSFKVDSDKFYMTFVDYIAPMYKLTSASSKDTLSWLCSHAEFNTGKIVLAPAIRKQICEDISISPNSLTNALKKLVELHLIDGEQGVYMINPQIFWKGSADKREELLNIEEIRVTFDIKLKEEK